ncbi:hypothetical protein ACSTB5_12760, partial [Faecalibacterium duncaniae]
LLGHGLQTPFRMVCGNFILPEFCKPCLFLCLFLFAQLIVPYQSIRSTRSSIRYILDGYAPRDEQEARIYGMKRGLEFIANRQNTITEENLHYLYQISTGDYAARAVILKDISPESVNCTPFVRQYGILFRKWGVFVCQRDNESTTERRR